MLRRPTAAGFSVLEVMITLSFFAGLSLVVWLAMSTSVGVWSRASGRDEAQHSLVKAWAKLRRDLTSARLSSTSFQIAESPPRSKSGEKNGDAIGFLSPVDPHTNDLVSKSDGSPFMMRTILYYLAIPVDDHCAGGADAAGYEVYCPHKMLVRCLMDSAPATPDGKDTQREESLNSDWPDWLEHPADVATSDVEREIVATKLLTFRVKVQGSSLQVELRATAIQEAQQKKVAVGTVDLMELPMTVRQVDNIRPQN